MCLIQFGQAQYAIGDFGSLGTGNWGTTNANWRQWNGTAWATVPAGAPTTADNVWILSGHTVTVEASPKNCKNLFVEAGGKLFANSATNRFINVYGNITCNGTIGNGTTYDGLGYNIEAASCLISGTGAFDGSRIRKLTATNPTTNLTFAMNVNLRFSAASTTQIYNGVGAASNFNVTVNSGCVLNLTGGATSGNAAIDGTNGAATGNAAGSFVINGTMYISGILYLTSNNTSGACSWTIGPTGYVRTNEIRAGASGAGTHSLTINGGGTLEINGTNAISTFSLTNNTYTCQTNSLVNYSAAGAQTVRSGISYAHLIISGSGSKTIDGNTTIAQNLTVSNPAIFAGSSFAVNLGGNWINWGTGGFTEGTSTVNWNGSSAQSMTSPGGEDFYALSMNNTSSTGLTLNHPATVANVLTMNDGLIYSTSSTLLTLNAAASTTGASNASFVDGPVRYLGNNALTFPVGKNSDYQPLGISAGAVSGGTFWTETFSNACASGCTLPYTGPNGTWTSASTGANGFDNNVWYVSGAECGNAAGACGSVCGATDPSLHMGSNGSVLGDNGAAYLAGGLGFWFPQTDLRAESPTINCTGYSNITLSFNYIENGQLTTDNATLWYFDGTTWTQLIDLAKTAMCGVQGTWTNYSALLPASADGNPNVKIGFRWVNNDDNVGTDPSFAVDDITLSVTGPSTSFTCEYFYANPITPYGNTLAPTLDHLDICEYWILDRDAGTENKFVTLAYDANSCMLPPSTLELRVASYDGISTWQDEGNSATTGTIAAGSVTSNLVTSFSPFTIASITPLILPVEWLYFDAFQNENSVELKWSTASETNCSYYEIQRSITGEVYEPLFRVDGNGSTSLQSNYTSYDLKPHQGVSYYRIKQVDFDGAYAFTSSKAVNFQSSESLFSLFPNPVINNEFSILFHEKPDVVFEPTVTDVSGKRIPVTFTTSDELSWKFRFTSTLSPGIYFFNLVTSNGRYSQRLILH